MKGRTPSMAELREFMRYDHNQNMSLDFDEFVAMQSERMKGAFTEAQFRAWFDEVDTDGNGSIDVNEFFAMKEYSLTDPPAVPVSAPSPRKPSMTELREFMKFDTDHSVTLDFDEFLAMQTAEVRAQFRDDELRAFFNEADTDGNGCLDPNEFFTLNGLLGRAARVRY